jgi:hypothetical protein
MPRWLASFLASLGILRPRLTQGAEVGSALRAFFLGAGLGFVFIILYSLQFPWLTGLSVVSVGAITGGAAAFIGGFLGFLFGIPRTPDPPASGTRTRDGEAAATAYSANTNLEQISDWLTKILVGVGLVQIGQLATQGEHLTNFLARGLGNVDSSAVFGGAVVTYFGLIGFLYGYLSTRLFLAGALTGADLLTRLRRIEDQPSKDGRALSLVTQQLRGAPGSADESQEDLNKVVAEASGALRIQIFYEAQALRSANWRTNPALMERTIPVFRALVNSDREARFHRNHAELGYALKDRTPPDFAEAERELTVAIAIRGRVGEQIDPYYEFARALCIIHQDPNFLASSASSPELRARILADLRVAVRSIRQIVMAPSNTDIHDWLRINSLSASEVG